MAEKATNPVVVSELEALVVKAPVAKTYDLIGQQSYKEFVGEQAFIRLATGEVREQGTLVLMRVDEATAKAVLALNGPGVFFGEIPV